MIWSRSHSPRSWSISRMGSPSRSVRAAHPRGIQVHQRHETAWTSGSSGASPTSTPPHAQSLVAQSCGRSHSSPREAAAALVEDEIDDFEHRGETLGKRLAARRFVGEARPRKACAWRGRMRWAMVASVTRKARAISSVVQVRRSCATASAARALAAAAAGGRP